MITGQNIVCISSIDWDFIWQGHQEIMATLAAAGNRVLFIENTGVRPVRFRDLPRVRQRLRNWRRGTNGFRQERANVFVFSPVVLPFPYSRIARWINRTLLLRAIRRWMRAVDFNAAIVWTFLPTPLARDLIRELDPRLIVYYCIDDLASSSHAARKITQTEDHVFREADLVFVTSEKLRERAARFSHAVHVFPFGVKFEAFERVRLNAIDAPADLGGLARPIVGYIGGLHQWVDQRLVAVVADGMRDASIVLIGPQQTDVTALMGHSNVYLLGARPHAELPSYLKAFDVGIIPYRSSEYTAHVYPTKLNEYLAMGIPVVATDLLEIRRFNERHGHLVAIATDSREFVDAVRAAALDSSPASVDRRVQVARTNSWTERIAEMSSVMEQALGAKASEADHWEVRLTRLYRTARRRARDVAAVVLGVYVLLFLTPALWIVASPLRVVAAPESADAIVVFGGGVGESGAAGGSYEERVKEAVDLYAGGYSKRVVFSSGFVYTFKEPDMMRALAVAQGVPPEDILLETHAASTEQNVLFVNDILSQHHWHRILLVSSPYNMRRALLTWHKLAPEVSVVATPVTKSQFYNHRFGASLTQILGIAHEYAAIVYYWLHGWI